MNNEDKIQEIYQKRIEEVAFQEGSMYDTIQEKNAAYNAAIKVATFALQNQWISVEEALPPIREKDIGNRSWSDWVIIMTHKGIAFMDCYAFHRKEWINNGNDVTYWMPIQSLKGGK